MIFSRKITSYYTKFMKYQQIGSIALSIREVESHYDSDFELKLEFHISDSWEKKKALGSEIFL